MKIVGTDVEGRVVYAEKDYITSKSPSEIKAMIAGLDLIDVCSLSNDYVRAMPAKTLISNNERLSQKGNVPLNIYDGLCWNSFSKSNIVINGYDLGRAVYCPIKATSYDDTKFDLGVPYIVVYLPEADFIYLVHQLKDVTWQYLTLRYPNDSRKYPSMDRYFDRVTERLNKFLCGDYFFFKLCGKVPEYRGKHRWHQKDEDTSHWIYGYVKDSKFGILDFWEDEFGITTLLDRLERCGLVRIPYLNLSCSNGKDWYETGALGHHFQVGLFDSLRKMYGLPYVNSEGTKGYRYITSEVDKGIEIIEILNNRLVTTGLLGFSGRFFRNENVGV